MKKGTAEITFYNMTKVNAGGNVDQNNVNVNDKMENSELSDKGDAQDILSDEATELSSENEDISTGQFRSDFQKRAEKRKTALEQREFQRNITTMRVQHENEKKRFHYREKTQHRKLQKWINKKLWHVDRLETKGDYQPKIQSFSSILADKPIQKFGKGRIIGSNAGVDGVNTRVDWNSASFFEYSEGEEDNMEEEGGDNENTDEVSEEEEEDDDEDEGNDQRKEFATQPPPRAPSPTRQMLNHAADVNTITVSPRHTSSLLAPSDRQSSASLRNHDKEEVSFVDDDSQFVADYMIQHFTTFAYHGEDNDGVQL